MKFICIYSGSETIPKGTIVEGTLVRENHIQLKEKIMDHLNPNDVFYMPGETLPVNGALWGWEAL